MTLAEAEEHGAKGTGAEDMVKLGWALVRSVETSETNPSLLEGE